MAERAADFRLAPGSEPDRQDRLPPPVLVGLDRSDTVRKLLTGCDSCVKQPMKLQ